MGTRGRILFSMVRVTVDSNVLRGDLERIRQASDGVDVEIVPTTVTLREHGALDDPRAELLPETGVYDESLYDSGAVYGGSPVYESLTLGESRLGMAVLAGDDSPPRLEAILAIVSDGSFPKPGQRANLTHGERRQLRDAMILEAHAREGRDVFVTNDRRGFVGKDGEKRRRLEDLCRTRIRTVEEFCAELQPLPE